MTIRDPEVIDLLADQPELLAIADAVSATQQQAAKPKPRRRRIAVRAALVAAAVAAALVAFLAAPQGRSGVVGRALAAIGNGPIMHVVIETRTGSVYVNLKTGRRTAQVLRSELWTDPQLHHFHLILSANGHVLGDLLYPNDAKPGSGAPTPSAGFATLWTGYRAALANGTVKLAGRGAVFGHPVYWLRFKTTGRHEPLNEVAVDVHTYRPVLYRTVVNGRHFDQRVLVAKAVPYDPADFARSAPSLESGNSSSGRSVEGLTSSPAPPPTPVVRAPWLTAGETVAGLKLRAANPFTETTDSGGKKTSMDGLELTYGPSAWQGTAVPPTIAATVDELPRPDSSQPFQSIPAGSVQVDTGEESSGKSRIHTTWTGYLRKNGIYVTINTPRSEHVLLAIARSLRTGS